MVTSPFDLSDEPDPAARVEATLADAATGLDAAKAYLSATAQTQLDGAAGALGNVRQRIQQMASAALAESQSLLESTRQALETHAQATLADSLTQAQEVGVDFPPFTPPTDTDLTCGDTYVSGPADATEPPVKAPAPKDVTVNVYCDKPKPAKKKAPAPATTPEEEAPPEEEPEPEPEPEPKPVKPAPCTRIAFDKDCSPELLTVIGNTDAYWLGLDKDKVSQQLAQWLGSGLGAVYGAPSVESMIGLAWGGSGDAPPEAPADRLADLTSPAGGLNLLGVTP